MNVIVGYIYHFILQYLHLSLLLFLPMFLIKTINDYNNNNLLNFFFFDRQSIIYLGQHIRLLILPELIESLLPNFRTVTNPPLVTNHQCDQTFLNEEWHSIEWSYPVVLPHITTGSFKCWIFL